MTKQATQKIRFNDDAYQFLMDITAPKDLSCTASLGEFVHNEALREIRDKVNHMQAKQ